MEQYNYGLLMVARQFRGYTQEEASNLIGISQGKLSKAEHQLQKLPPEVFEKAAQIYDFPVDFFKRAEDHSAEEHFYFRRKQTIPVRTIESFKATVQVLKLTLDDLLEPIELPECTLPSLSPRDYPIKDIAATVRHKLGIGPGPISNLTAILEKNGVLVFRFDFGTNKLDGLSTITNSGHVIVFLNSQMPNDRNRFSLAHEIGHIVMHLGQGEPGSETLEKQADEFASDFLLPQDEIGELLSNINLTILAELKRRWKVSMRALIRRAKDLNCITEHTYRSFQITFSKKGYNRQEPIALAPENPTVIKDCIMLYKRELGYNDDDLMRIMNIKQSDYTTWFSIKPIYPLNFKLSLGL